MPATRVTIALNTNQSQKTPLLIPSSASANPVLVTSIRSLVFKTAQSKLRLKKPTRVYVSRSGQELLTEEDWKATIRDDLVLLISAGEDYVGVKKHGIVHADVNVDCPVEVLASKAAVGSLSLTQLTTTAHTLPGIVYAVGQPDLHLGNKFPIGAVFASRKWIHPPLIGSDIGCGMAWYKTSLPRSQVDGNKGKKVAEKLRGLEGPWRTQTHRELWLQDGAEQYSAGENWDRSLGTIGAGNHFAEIQIVEEFQNEDTDPGLRQNDVVLLVHSGSRGYGGSVLTKFTAESNSSLEDDSQEAVQYMKEHDKACQWAKANRDLIALRFLACLEPGNESWQLGSSASEESDHFDPSEFEKAKQALQERKVVDIWHNNVERVKWPPMDLSTGGVAERSSTGSETTKRTADDSAAKQEYVYIHRKGAAPTYNPGTQEPLQILPLPGSRGTLTMILKPTFSASTSWGYKNALSLAHGAGRAMSRAKALSSLSQKYKGQNILEPRASDIDGTWVICDEKDLVFEEAPDAYKDVEAVGQDLVDAGAAQVVGWCRPRVSYKVRNEAR
ncbi:release factor H-coupled R [Pyrenochaeta sp. DS3sAY3a]|nr:release factor H-coupled R [Pyrenochaeta sp. DS3sAY3a]